MKGFDCKERGEENEVFSLMRSFSASVYDFQKIRPPKSYICFQFVFDFFSCPFPPSVLPFDLQLELHGQFN